MVERSCGKPPHAHTYHTVLIAHIHVQLQHPFATLFPLPHIHPHLVRHSSPHLQSLQRKRQRQLHSLPPASNHSCHLSYPQPRVQRAVHHAGMQHILLLTLPHHLRQLHLCQHKPPSFSISPSSQSFHPLIRPPVFQPHLPVGLIAFLPRHLLSALALQPRQIHSLLFQIGRAHV